MSKSARLERVTCTLPADLVKAADALAAQARRSRSQVVAEALREFTQAWIPAPSASEREAALKLTPEERVRFVETQVRALDERAPRPRLQFVASFDSYEDFLDWQAFLRRVDARREAAATAGQLKKIRRR